MKKTVSIFLCIVMLMSLSLTGCAAEQVDLAPNSAPAAATEIALQINNPNMTVNGEAKPIDDQGTAPILVNDRTLLPVRAIVEEMGGTVLWDEENQRVTLTYGEDVLTLEIDNPVAYCNDEAKTLDVAPAIINDRTMMPIRFIAESFGFAVDWAEDTQTVTVSKANGQPEAEEQPAATAPPAEENSGTLVAYFSCTNNTEGIAKHIAEGLGADIYEIAPEIPYTEADLDYNTDCRANREQNDESARPGISGSVENMARYDKIYLGYPIWWGNAPKIIFTFLESYDFSGKTIIPFCTSGSSPIGSTDAMEALTPGAVWLEGHRFSGGSSSDTVMEWVNGIEP